MPSYLAFRAEQVTRENLNALKSKSTYEQWTTVSEES